MCGRYALAPGSVRWDEVAAGLGADIAAAIGREPPRYNIAPSTSVPILVPDATAPAHLVAARWQFIPPWWKADTAPRFATINARSEKAASKPLWRDAWRHGRCLIPASHWFEWQPAADGKQPFALQAAGGEGFLFAGLYAPHPNPPAAAPALSFAILTRAAPPELRGLHERMPALLAGPAWRAWLDPELTAPERVDALLRSHALTHARAWPIGARINSPRNQEAALLERVAAPQQ